jgi:hypothetical protein
VTFTPDSDPGILSTLAAILARIVEAIELESAALQVIGTFLVEALFSHFLGYSKFSPLDTEEASV